MGQRKAIATRYPRARKADKGKILDELCATTGWRRNPARKAPAAALRLVLVRPARRPRTPTYGPDVVVALRFCWAVLGAPTGKRLAPVMAEPMPTLRRFGELDVSDQVAAALVAMSPATMDRRLAADRAAMTLCGRCHTKPGSLLKDGRCALGLRPSLDPDAYLDAPTPQWRRSKTDWEPLLTDPASSGMTCGFARAVLGSNQRPPRCEQAQAARWHQPSRPRLRYRAPSPRRRVRRRHVPRPPALLAATTLLGSEQAAGW